MPCFGGYEKRVTRERGNLTAHGQPPPRRIHSSDRLVKHDPLVEQGRFDLLYRVEESPTRSGNAPRVKLLVNDSLMKRETAMAWTTPTLVEICIGLEINGYLPAEF